MIDIVANALAPVFQNPLAAFLFAVGILLIVIALWGWMTGKGVD